MAKRHCSKCGQPTTSREDPPQCRDCWRTRGSDLPEDKKVKHVAGCGHPCRKPGARLCGDCKHAKAYEPVPDIPRDYDEALQLWRQIIGCTKREYAGPAKHRQSDVKRIAICSDLHAPFQHTEALASFIEREKGADVCIVAGDLQDHYAISRFTKFENVPIHQELAAAQMILERLSEAFPIVLLLEGNHDKSRFEKLLYDRLPMDAIEIVRYLSRTGGLSTMQAMASQFTNVEVVKNRIDDRYDVSWYLQHGDLLVTHAEKFSRVPGATLRGIEDWASDFEGALGLKPWRVLCQAHTHQLGWFPYGADRVLVETGCLCRVHGYQLSAKIGGRPQRVGWVTLEQKGGSTDLSSIRPFWWEKAA